VPQPLADRLVAAIPSLARPLVFLEGGANRAGVARLAWGATDRCRLSWGADPLDAMSWLEKRDGRRAYGVLAYDAGLPPKAVRRRPLVDQPVAEFFVPEHEVVVDLAAGVAIAGDIDALPSAGRRGQPIVRGASLVDRSFAQPEFENAVRRVRDYVAAGDVYQVNLAVAQRFRIAVAAWDAYVRLRAANPSPWMGFADFGDWQIASSSPELLIEVGATVAGGGRSGGRLVRTRPIAGTRKKTGDPRRDRAMRRELRLDEKERAEHRMLVDLARNDIGRVARYGSVAVRELEVVEEYSHVFHLVSEVTGALREDCSTADALLALFPGGTITGAPKIRAMEVIAELEPVARGAYTGSLGWIDAEAMQFNILIRSAVIRDGTAVVQAGAGIVWDSDPAREWRESLRKAAAVCEALGAGGV
jgi:anthranilate/para-aminobenzoate synthase component I